MRRIVLVASLSCIAVPVLAAPCAGFSDVDTSSPYCSSVEWIKNRGVTLGCTASLYCPQDDVTRLQMAIFLHRFSNAVHQQGGNAFGTTAVLGTTDQQFVDIRVGNARIMRYAPGDNLIGGHPGNAVIFGTTSTIGGGGTGGAGCHEPSTGVFNRSCANEVYGSGATVAGGFANQAGSAGFVGGGSSNSAGVGDGSHATVGGGSGNTARGLGGTVPGGYYNVAAEDFSFAAGFRAKATTKGTFMWADSRNFDFVPSVDNFFGVRATGGVGMTVAIDPNTGGVMQFCNYLPGFSGWSCTSDRDAKENFVPANGEEILAKLVAMPLYSWNYKGADPSLRMLGPTAQDFDAAFGLGNADKTIASGNLDGVALAAIQGLNAKLEALLAQRDAEIRALRAELEALRARGDAIAVTDFPRHR